MKNYQDNEIEIINKERLELINSNEYNTGRRIIKIWKMIKKFQIIKLIYEIKKHKEINKMSSKNLKQYDMIRKNNINYEEKKIVVYTCITGNYDKVFDNYFWSDNVDYVLFSDSKELCNRDSNWKRIDISEIDKIKKMSLVEKNRYIKLHPYEFFQNKYDYAIYIDGNIQIVSDIRKLINGISDDYGIAMHRHRDRIDIYNEFKVCKILKKGNYINLKKQIKSYKEEGFPKNYGMLEANVIYIDLKNNTGSAIMESWWKEFFYRKSGRDQISLPYVLWKQQIETSKIATLGSNVYKNPIFFIDKHNK